MHRNPGFAIIKKRVAEKGYMTIPSNGYSMYPAIRPGDECVFKRVEERELAPGDILLFENEHGILVGHRLVRIEGAGPGRSYVCKGDTNLHPDLPVAFDSIAGKLSEISRGNGGSRRRRISNDSRTMAIWGRTMMKAPILSVLLRKWVGRLP